MRILKGQRRQYLLLRRLNSVDEGWRQLRCCNSRHGPITEDFPQELPGLHPNHGVAHSHLRRTFVAPIHTIGQDR